MPARGMMRATCRLIGVLCLSWLAAARVFGQVPEIQPAPAFSAEELVAQPTDGWITNGGNVFNQRYSPLTQINRDNVAELKALWRTGMGSGAAQNNSGQAQIIEYEDTLYVINGVNDVFALDIDTGAILWTYHGNPDSRAGKFISRSSRGVAIGDGKVFAALLDARLVALDQETGKPVWDVEAVHWQDGFSMTSAPLYFDGLVIVGFSGGEMASRGKVRAFDADDGSLIWTFNTVPGPGELGHDTWPQNTNAWEYGGAPVWIPSSDCFTSRPATRVPICMAESGPATTSSASRLSPSMRIRASIAGIFSRSITIYGITIRRIPSSCSMPRSAGGCAKGSSRFPRRAGPISSTAKQVSP
jgi:glucose dehydrogenase